MTVREIMEKEISSKYNRGNRFEDVMATIYNAEKRFPLAKGTEQPDFPSRGIGYQVKGYACQIEGNNMAEYVKSSASDRFLVEVKTAKEKIMWLDLNKEEMVKLENSGLVKTDRKATSHGKEEVGRIKLGENVRVKLIMRGFKIHEMEY